MSQLVTLDIKLSNINTIILVCKRLKWNYTEDASQQFYDKSIAHGLKVEIPGWKYPIIIENSGTVRFDNYNGSWGEDSHLGLLKQAYALEGSRALLASQGMSLYETVNDDNSITLTANAY